MKKPITVNARQLTTLIREAVMTSDNELNELFDELESIHERLRAAAERVQENDEEFDLVMAIVQRMNEITAIIDRNRDIGPEHVTRWPEPRLG